MFSVPVYHCGPYDGYQEDSVFFGAQRASVQKEREMWTHHDQKALTEVPVPRMSPVKLSHALKYIQLQKIPLDKNPLQINNSYNIFNTPDICALYTPDTIYVLDFRSTFP